MLESELQTLQALPLTEKVLYSKSLIADWYQHFDGKVAVSFSGGKDSTVLLHLVRSLYPEVPAVFCNTGLEFPEVRAHAKATENIIIVKPELNFRQVIDSYGWVFPSKDVAEVIYRAKKGVRWAVRRLDGLNASAQPTGFIQTRFAKWKFLLEAPFKISHLCCEELKEKPMRIFQKASGLHMFLGLMSTESYRRKLAILKANCNAYDITHPASRPLAFWSDQDILLYIYNHNLKIPSIYGDIVCRNGKLTTTGEKRTGCMFCLIGCHLQSPNKFQRMRLSHPNHYKYCMEQLGLHEVLTWLDVPH